MGKKSYGSTNVFLSMIYDKIVPTPWNWIKCLLQKHKVNKYMKKINTGSPGFGLLWKMADFIKYAEQVFFYDNNVKNTEFGLFSSYGYASGENGFKVIDVDCIIVVKLFSDSQKVIVEVERLLGNKIKTKLSFQNEQWEDGEPSICDEMILEEVIKRINCKFINLFYYYYEKM